MQKEEKQQFQIHAERNNNSMRSRHSVNRQKQTISNDQDSRRREEKQHEDQNFHQNRANFSYQSNSYRKYFKNLLCFQLLIREKIDSHRGKPRESNSNNSSNGNYSRKTPRLQAGNQSNGNQNISRSIDYSYKDRKHFKSMVRSF
jgi:hypothetical protein